MNDYFKSTPITVNDGKINIGKLDINHPMEYLYQTFKKNLFLVLNFNIDQLNKLLLLKNYCISKTF